MAEGRAGRDKVLYALAVARRLLILLVLLSIGARVVNLDGPPIGHHQWRQCDTAGVARAYARGQTTFTRPLVDWRGDTSGVAETEFPIYAYATGILERAIYGPPPPGAKIHHWIPRLLSILGAVATLAMAYDLVRLRSGVRVASYTMAVLAMLPLFTFYGRTIQPESWMNAAFVGAVWAMARRNASESRAGSAWFIASACMASLAILLKLPSLVVGLPLALLVIERIGPKDFGVRVCAMWFLYGTIALAPAAVWYAHARGLAAESGLSFGILSSNKWGDFGALATADFYRNVFVGKLGEDHLAIVAVPLVLLGLTMRRRERSERVFDAWTAAMLVHIALIPIGHKAHDYYQLPLTVPLAFYAGRFLARARFVGRPRLATLVRVVALAALSGTSAYTLARLYQKERARPSADLVLALSVAEATDASDNVAIIVAPGHRDDPTILYLADRRGWTLTPDLATLPQLNELRGRGCVLAATSRQIVRDEPAFNSLVREFTGRGSAADASDVLLVPLMASGE